MRAQINLATEPFRRDRVFLVSSAAIAAGLIVLFLLLIGAIAGDRRRMQANLTALNATQRELSRLTRDQRKLDSELRQTNNANVLERSQFINTLLYRKGISWTRLFADLEKVVPTDVRIISIRPQVDAQDHVLLEMTVGAQTQKPVIDLLTRFESSDLFGSTAVRAIIPPSQTDPLFRYTVSVDYAQKL